MSVQLDVNYGLQTPATRALAALPHPNALSTPKAAKRCTVQSTNGTCELRKKASVALLLEISFRRTINTYLQVHNHIRVACL